MLLNYLLVIINYWMSVGSAAILHNGVIVPGVLHGRAV